MDIEDINDLKRSMVKVHFKTNIEVLDSLLHVLHESARSGANIDNGRIEPVLRDALNRVWDCTHLFNRMVAIADGDGCGPGNSLSRTDQVKLMVQREAQAQHELQS
ncbi:MAG: hypothetical protein HQK58_11020 [Deltaproteobacteria bacterium]|nr:hypothetical protein [Deltaproteobacteria bacterium]